MENFGKIQIGEKEVGSSLSYLNKDAEYAAFFAIPYVLKRGIIDGHLNHKNKGFKTATFAAPVTVNGEPGILAVVVKLTRGYRYKTHRILSPDGTEFKFVKKKKRLQTSV